MAQDLEAPWAPTEREAALVEFLASEDLPGATELRAQVPGMMVARNCDCGCGSFSIYVRDDAPTSEWSHPTTSGAVGRDGAPLSAFLFTQGGRLAGTEITYHAGAARGVPVVDELQFS